MTPQQSIMTVASCGRGRNRNEKRNEQRSNYEIVFGDFKKRR